MEAPSISWQQETEASNLIQPYEMRPQNQPSPQQQAAVLEGDFQDSLSFEDYDTYFRSPESTSLNIFSSSTGVTSHPGCFKETRYSLQSESRNPNSSEQVPVMASTYLQMGSIGGADEMSILIPHVTYETLILDVGYEKTNTESRSPCYARDRAISERKRREKFSALFMELSAIIPGPKKVDKISLLGDATNYIKQLEVKVEALEEKGMKRTKELIFLEKKQVPSMNDNNLLSSDDPFNKPNLQIEARMAENNILIVVQCGKHKGVLVKVISEIEKFHLTVMNTSILPFTTSTLNITVMAKIEYGFSMTMKDLKKNLMSSFSQIM